MQTAQENAIQPPLFLSCSPQPPFWELWQPHRGCSIYLEPVQAGHEPALRRRPGIGSKKQLAGRAHLLHVLPSPEGEPSWGCIDTSDAAPASSPGNPEHPPQPTGPCCTPAPVPQSLGWSWDGKGLHPTAPLQHEHSSAWHLSLAGHAALVFQALSQTCTRYPGPTHIILAHTMVWYSLRCPVSELSATNYAQQCSHHPR